MLPLLSLLLFVKDVRCSGTTLIWVVNFGKLSDLFIDHCVSYLNALSISSGTLAIFRARARSHPQRSHTYRNRFLLLFLSLVISDRQSFFRAKRVRTFGNWHLLGRFSCRWVHPRFMQSQSAALRYCNDVWLAMDISYIVCFVCRKRKTWNETKWSQR